MPQTKLTYKQPEDGWVCFHCGERFTVVGAARDHFGEWPEMKPACQIKAGEERGLLMELRRKEEEIKVLRNEIAMLIEFVGAQHDN